MEKTVALAEGLEEYPKTGAVVGNMVMLLWIILGTAACWFLYPLAGIAYFGFAMLMVYVVLRKLVCTNCYYYDRWCGIGWGKLSAMLFERGDIEHFAGSTGVKLAPAVYGLLSILPIIFIIISLFQGFSVSKVAVLVILMLISFYSGAVSRRKTCERCRMRTICPGSAVK